MIYKPINDQDPRQVEFYKSYFEIRPDRCETYYYSTEPIEVMDVYVIAFNNLLLAEYQIKTLRRFMKTPFNLILVDNNNGLHPEVSLDLLRLCIDEKVTYIRAPNNFYQEREYFDPTMKLGTTMNWLYVSCILYRQPKYFGFLDQDCFLIRDVDLRPYLDDLGMYGRVIHSKVSQAWNLHVTTNFFRSAFVMDRLLDFRASHPYQLDTGGANYEVLYKDYQADDYELDFQAVRFDRQDVNRKDSVQHYELIDRGAWYHMCASSHDQLAGDGLYKLAYSKGFLDSRLQNVSI